MEGKFVITDQHKNTVRKDANYLKAAFIDYVFSLFNPQLIANEVSYGIKRKICDLLIINNNRTISVEIKSELDSDSRLAEQLTESSKTFDYVIAFVDRSFLPNLQDRLPSNVGLYSLIDGKITRLRRSHINKTIALEIAYSIPYAYLKTQFKLKGNFNVDSLRHYVSLRYPRKLIHIYQEYLYKKYHSRFELFVTERGEITHIEDLRLFSFGEILL